MEYVHGESCLCNIFEGACRTKVVVCQDESKCSTCGDNCEGYYCEVCSAVEQGAIALDIDRLEQGIPFPERNKHG